MMERRAWGECDGDRRPIGERQLYDTKKGMCLNDTVTSWGDEYICQGCQLCISLL